MKHGSTGVAEASMQREREEARGKGDICKPLVF
jgi:hypothetical protein